jgi:hypothetical protein
MNEISILMYLLSQRGSHHEFGATREEIIDRLNPGKKAENFVFNNVMTKLSNYIDPLGFQINYNPLNSHWYLSIKNEITEFFGANPFNEHPSLAATLFCTLTCCLKNRGKTSIQEIKKIRKKKNLISDLKALETKGYISINSKNRSVELTPLIGYQIDIERLYNNIVLMMKDEIK